MFFLKNLQLYFRSATKLSIPEINTSNPKINTSELRFGHGWLYHVRMGVRYQKNVFFRQNYSLLVWGPKISP